MEYQLPDPIRLGNRRQYDIGTLLHRLEDNLESASERKGLRCILGKPLPSWQRDLVWSEEQQVSFIESILLGLDLGTYSVVTDYIQEDGTPYPFSNMLLDGQQRLHSIERFVNDEILVFGVRFSDLTRADKRRRFLNRIFECYELEADEVSEKFLRDYYNRLNFGGVNHTDSQRA